MAFDPKTPGVYVQEVSIFPPSVTSVATAIPAFLGYTEKAPTSGLARITSMNDYIVSFGGAYPYVKLDVTAAPPLGGYVPTYENHNFFLYYAMQMYFANGGGPCYVISVGSYSSTPDAAHFGSTWNTGGFEKLVLEDEPTLIVMPELRLIGVSAYSVYVNALDQCSRLQDRFVIVDCLDLPSSVNFSTDIANIQGGVGNQFLKYGAAYYPDLLTSLSYPPEAVKLTQTGGQLDGKTMAAVIASTVEAVAQAWVLKEQDIRAALTKTSISLPPSSSIAGVYAAVDRSRGVWKAPANVSLNAVVKPTVTLTNDNQDGMNKPTNGKAVNAIRAFTGKGILVWGARTLAGNDNEWRYVPVRRLFIMVEESIRKATEWVVFEPNDANTWLKVKTMIENYLLNLWKDGALAGAVPKDAFFVKVGLNQTMTAQDILEGKLIVEIGMAAVRPAEFILLKFSHKIQES